MRRALGLVVLLAALLCVGMAQGQPTVLNSEFYFDFNCSAGVSEALKDYGPGHYNLAYVGGGSLFACNQDNNGTSSSAMIVLTADRMLNNTGAKTTITGGATPRTMIAILKTNVMDIAPQHAIGGFSNTTHGFIITGDEYSTGSYIGGNIQVSPISEYIYYVFPGFSADTWFCLVLNQSGDGTAVGTLSFQKDGVVQTSYPTPSGNAPDMVGATDIWVGKTPMGADAQNMTLALFAAWNFSLTKAEIMQVCYNGIGGGGAPSDYNNITIHLDNVYNSTFIQEFSVNIGNSTWNRSYDVTDGALSLNISWGYWLNFTSPIFYPHSVYINATSGGVFSGSTYQSILTVIANEFMSNTSLSAFNATVGSVTNRTTNGSTRFFVDAGTYLPIVAAPGYWPGTWIPVTVAAQGFETANASLYSSYITVKATSVMGAAISTITLNVSWLNYTYFSSNSANNGSVHFYLINGSYNISFESSGYVPTSALLTVTKYNHTVHFTDIYQLNTVNITFKFQGNVSKIDQRTVYSEFSSSTYSYQWNTSNGTLFKALVSPEEYQIFSYGLGLTSVYTQFGLANETYNEFSIYLADNASLTACTVTIVDQNSQRVEGAEIRVLRYDVGSNTYFQVDAPKTNFNGEVILNLILYNQYYKFQILLDGTLLKTTLPGVITSCPFNIQIQTGGILTGTFFQTRGIAYTLNYTMVTQNFNFEYADLTGTTTSGCLAVYVWDKNGKTAYNSSCVASASGNVLVGAPANNGTTYVGYGYVIYGGNYHNLASLVKSWGTYVDTGIMGYFLIFCIIVLFVLLGIHSPPVALVGAPVAMILASVSGISPFPVSIAITWLVMAIMLVVLMNRRAS